MLPARRPKRSTSPDEALQARVAAAVCVLRRLIAQHDPKQHLFTEQQQAWRDAAAWLAESEAGK